MSQRSSDEQFEYDLKKGWALEDYLLKQLRKLGYYGQVDHRLLRTRCSDQTHSSQSDRGDLVLWHQDTETFIADVKGNVELNAFLPGDDWEASENVLDDLLDSNLSHTWIAQDTSIIKIHRGDIDISHYKFFICPQPEYIEGPDGDPQVASHIPWTVVVDGASFETWSVKRRSLSQGRKRSWYVCPITPDLEIIDLSVDAIRQKQVTDSNPSDGFDVAHKISVDLNSYRQEN